MTHYRPDRISITKSEFEGMRRSRSIHEPHVQTPELIGRVCLFAELIVEPAIEVSENGEIKDGFR